MKTDKNHFHDWLFYLFATLLVLFASGFIKFYEDYNTSFKELKLCKDTISTYKSLMMQGKLIAIVNESKEIWTVKGMIIGYINNKSKLTTYIKDDINESISQYQEIKLTGNKYEDKDNNWNNLCLYYTISCTRVDQSGNKIYQMISNIYPINVFENKLKIK